MTNQSLIDSAIFLFLEFFLRSDRRFCYIFCEEIKSDFMKAIRDISFGQTWRLKKPVLLTSLANMANIVPFYYVLEVINIIFKSFDGSGETLNVRRLWTICVILVCYISIQIVAERAAYRANFRGAYEISSDGRLRLAEHIAKLSLGFLSIHDPGDLSSMMITDFMMAETGISHILPQLIGALVMPFLSFISLIWIDWRMAIAMFISFPVAVVVLQISNLLQNHLGMRQIKAKINAGNRLEEYLQGMRVIKAYNLVGERFSRLKNAFAELRKASLLHEALLGPFMLLSITFIRSGLTLMIQCGVYLLIGGRLSVPTFVLFLVVGSRVFDPLSSALTNFAEFRYYAMAGGRIKKLLEEPEMDGSSDAPESGDIVFSNVSFAYQKQEVLRDINLTIKKGELTALVGPSGSGKSTIMKLCARFYDPMRGKITFDGEDISKIEPEKLMSRISMVFQDVYLFQDTIKNNIRFGSNNATDDEIIEAAKQSCCHDFIMRLPLGYDTMVGEGGCTLSGGEKQRISIARAILKKAPIVLLDEATASLDPENEVEVQKAISSLVEGRTVVAIAHRLKTIKEADKIVVLNKGSIIEEGTHDSLLKKQGVYNNLWTIQEKTIGWSI